MAPDSGSSMRWEAVKEALAVIKVAGGGGET